MLKQLRMLRDGNCIEFSTGAKAYMDGVTIQDGIESFNNLLYSIVMEHFEEILKMAKVDPDINGMPDLLADEVSHLIDNEIVEHRLFLGWMLHILALEKFHIIQTELEKRRHKSSKKAKRDQRTHSEISRL